MNKNLIHFSEFMKVSHCCTPPFQSLCWNLTRIWTNVHIFQRLFSCVSITLNSLFSNRIIPYKPLRFKNYAPVVTGLQLPISKTLNIFTLSVSIWTLSRQTSSPFAEYDMLWIQGTFEMWLTKLRVTNGQRVSILQFVWKSRKHTLHQTICITCCVLGVLSCSQTSKDAGSSKSFRTHFIVTNRVSI
jgi:hypothetical protein